MKRAVAGLAAGGLLLALGACGARDPGAGPSPRGVGTTTLDWAGLRTTLSLLPSSPDRLRVRAVVRNVTDGPVTREVPWCVIWLRLYRDGRLVLDHGAREGCPGAIRVLALAPGEERVFHESLLARQVLPEGTEEACFLVRAYVPRGGRPGLPRAEMEATLGDAELRIGTDPGAPDSAAANGSRPGMDAVTRT